MGVYQTHIGARKVGINLCRLLEVFHCRISFPFATPCAEVPEMILALQVGFQRLGVNRMLVANPALFTWGHLDTNLISKTPRYPTLRPVHVAQVPLLHSSP